MSRLIIIFDWAYKLFLNINVRKYFYNGFVLNNHDYIQIKNSILKKLSINERFNTRVI